MSKLYDPASTEASCQALWRQHYSGQARTHSPYCIPLPPPNVTGVLHMGHGFQQTLMDALIRYQHMQGRSTLWQAGTDHAGIATQMVVERQLQAEGTSKEAIGREAFNQRIHDWQQQSSAGILSQITRLGTLIDHDDVKFSLDPTIKHATVTAFRRLYEDGLIVKKKRMVNWDTQLKTAISDLEVDNQTVQGHLWSLRYPIIDSNDSIVIATTRPETLLGDTAIAVHPDDPRYQHLIGQKAIVPICHRQIPIVADTSVDPEFGTGCVKITPAHDFNDFELGQRHQLPIIDIMTDDGRLNESVPEAFQGLSIADARHQVIAYCKAQGCLVATDPHTHVIPVGDRSGTVCEPRLTDQWYVLMSKLAQQALQALHEQQSPEFIPSSWLKVYQHWLENCQDWCISRQLWWGHQIPVWTAPDGNTYIGDSAEAVRDHYQLSDQLPLTQDPDVLDTWFTAALWPFSSLGWPEHTAKMQQFYPGAVLVTGFDIIFFWVARMVMMGCYLTGTVPFKQVMITGLIRDQFGRKMSKSEGNVINPLHIIDGIDLESLVASRTQNLMQPQKAKKIEQATRKQFPHGIEAYGTDALRLTFCSLATQAQDINFDLSRLDTYRHFCNKLWNAARYVLMNHNDQPACEREHHPIDLWLQQQLALTINAVNQHMNEYRFDLVMQTLYEFIWRQYCDWYLELSKAIIHDPQAKPAVVAGTKHTLVSALSAILRLLHPLAPFVTESIWQQLPPCATEGHPSIITAAFPVAHTALDQEAYDSIEWIKQFISQIRTIRSEMGITPKQAIGCWVHSSNPCLINRIKQHEYLVQSLARVDTIRYLDQCTKRYPISAQFTQDELTCTCILEGLINVEQECQRIQKQIAKLEKTAQQLESKLANPGFLKQAPAEVIAAEQKKHQGLIDSISRLTQHHQSLTSQSV